MKILPNVAKYRSIEILFRIAERSITMCHVNIINYQSMFVLNVLQVQQTDIDDEQLAREIAAKLGDTPGISYTEIASNALDQGRTALAIKVLILF